MLNKLLLKNREPKIADENKIQVDETFIFNIFLYQCPSNTKEDSLVVTWLVGIIE